MNRILITGSDGFVGRNLYQHLSELEMYEILTYDIQNSKEELNSHLENSDFIFHLAGVNRPEKDEDFKSGNIDLTAYIVSKLISLKSKIPLVFSSSIQVTRENPYGRSKLAAEDLIRKYQESGGRAFIYRLHNLFGKWCRPNYNSVVATFCYNIARDEEISISDPDHELELIYIDDIIKEFIYVIQNTDNLICTEPYNQIQPSYRVTLGELARIIINLKQIRHHLKLPDLSDDFTRKLHSTFISYLPVNQLSYIPDYKTDNRGNLFELFKSDHSGQVFVSTTKPGIVRGNHYHHSKVEKFCVIQGEARISFRHILFDEVVDYNVSGKAPCVVDIPPGYTHSIENTGEMELICLFWANEEFNREDPDTYYIPVIR